MFAYYQINTVPVDDLTPDDCIASVAALMTKPCMCTHTLPTQVKRDLPSLFSEEIVKLMAQLMVIVCCVCGERAGQRVFLPCTHVRFCDSCGPDPGRCPECSPTNTTRGNTGNGAWWFMYACYTQASNRWLSAKLQYLHCVSNGVTAVLH